MHGNSEPPATIDHVFRATSPTVLGRVHSAGSSLPTLSSGMLLAGSTQRLTLTGCRGRLDRVQHAMARDRVVERGAEMRSLAIVAGEARVCLGDVSGRARDLRGRPPILLPHRQDLERGLRAPATAYGALEDFGLAAGPAGLQI